MLIAMLRFMLNYRLCIHVGKYCSYNKIIIIGNILLLDCKLKLNDIIIYKCVLALARVHYKSLSGALVAA